MESIAKAASGMFKKKEPVNGEAKKAEGSNTEGSKVGDPKVEDTKVKKPTIPEKCKLLSLSSGKIRSHCWTHAN